MKNLINYLKEYFKDIKLKDISFQDIAGAASRSSQNQ